VATLPPCPICRRPAAALPGNRSYPFCSDRCRFLDLGKWMGGQYRVPGPALGDAEDDGPPPRLDRDDDGS